jgi:hypothetical protein
MPKVGRALAAVLATLGLPAAIAAAKRDFITEHRVLAILVALTL